MRDTVKDVTNNNLGFKVLQLIICIKLIELQSYLRIFIFGRALLTIQKLILVKKWKET